MLVGLFLNHCFHHRQIPGASIFLNLPFPGCVDPGVARTRRSLPLLRRNPLCYPLQYYGACKTKGKIWRVVVSRLKNRGVESGQKRTN